MKKIIGIIVGAIILIGIIVGVIIFAINKDTRGTSRVKNIKAEKKKDERFLTINNKTDLIINEVHIYLSDGTELEDAFQKNPDEKCFSIKINEEFNEYDKFKVELIDRYGRKYVKSVDKVKKTGRTAVSITKDDYKKQKGDFKRNLDAKMNGD